MMLCSMRRDCDLLSYSNSMFRFQCLCATLFLRKRRLVCCIASAHVYTLVKFFCSCAFRYCTTSNGIETYDIMNLWIIFYGVLPCVFLNLLCFFFFFVWTCSSWCLACSQSCGFPIPRDTCCHSSDKVFLYCVLLDIITLKIASFFIWKLWAFFVDDFLNCWTRMWVGGAEVKYCIIVLKSWAVEQFDFSPCDRHFCD